MLPFIANSGHYVGYGSYSSFDFQTTQLLSQVHPYYYTGTDHYNHLQFGHPSFSPYSALPTYSRRFERRFVNTPQRSVPHPQPPRRMFGAARQNMPPNVPHLVTGGERIVLRDEGSANTDLSQEYRPPSALAPMFDPFPANTTNSSGSKWSPVSPPVIYSGTAGATLPSSRRSRPPSALAPTFVPRSAAAEAAVQLQSYQDNTQSQSSTRLDREPEAQQLYTNVFSSGRETKAEDEIGKTKKTAPVRCVEEKLVEQEVSSPSRISSADSVGNWTDDEIFFPCMKKHARLNKAKGCP